MPLLIDGKNESRWEPINEMNIESGALIISRGPGATPGSILCMLKAGDTESIIASTRLSLKAAAEAAMHDALLDEAIILAELRHEQSYQINISPTRSDSNEVLRFSHQEGRLAIGNSIPDISDRIKNNTLAQLLRVPEFFSKTNLPFKLHVPFAEMILLRGSLPPNLSQRQEIAFITSAKGICAKHRLTDEEETRLIDTLSRSVRGWRKIEDMPIN